VRIFREGGSEGRVSDGVAGDAGVEGEQAFLVGGSPGIGVTT